MRGGCCTSVLDGAAARELVGQLLRQDGTVAQRPIRPFGDPVLRTRCDAVDKFDGVLIGLVADLEETVSAPDRAGVAANQIGGELARLCLQR